MPVPSGTEVALSRFLKHLLQSRRGEMAGASALREYAPMIDEVILDEQRAEREAASKAVRDVPDFVVKLGGTKEHGRALAEAMRLVLQGCSKDARRVLVAANYPADSIEQIMQQLERGLKSAA